MKPIEETKPMKKNSHKYLLVAAVVGCLLATPLTSAGQQKPEALVPPAAGTKAAPVHLSEEHRKAVNRRRRIAVNNDVGYPAHLFGIDVKKWVDFRFTFPDEPGNQIDSLWWCLDEGNLAFYPSKILPVTKSPQMRKWLDAGIDILEVAVEESHKRGIEAFYTHRLNGFDGEWLADGKIVRPINLPMKDQHPDWLLDWTWGPGKLWNFAIEGVREYKVAVLRELAENYDFDGIDINFARHPPCLPIGHQWEHRHAMTDFVRRVRLMLQEVAEKRGRPILLSVQVPCTIAGCHYDGYDVETWVRQNLIDIIAIGTHSFDVDLEDFRRITEGKNIKLYPCMDDAAHSPSGYTRPPIEVERGFAANWWRQGADGILTFNWANAPKEANKALRFPAFSPSHQQAYREIGDPGLIRFKDKTFVVTRRFGGGWKKWSGPKKWNFYQGMNIQAPLPALLPAADMPAILTIYVADDLAGNAGRVKSADLRLLLSGAAAGEVVEAKLNGVLLPAPKVKANGWRVFETTPRQFAVGRNLVYLHLGQRPAGSKSPVTIEKLEVHVAYK